MEGMNFQNICSKRNVKGSFLDRRTITPDSNIRICAVEERALE